MHVTLGAPGRIMPPAGKAIEFAQRAEQDGFDAIWWPCHLMGWVPDSVWTEDWTELAPLPAEPARVLRPADDDGRGRRGDRAHQGRRVRDGHDPPPPGDARPGDADRRPPLGRARDPRPRLRRAHERAALRDGVAQAGRAPRGGDPGDAAAVEHRQAGRLRRRVLPAARRRARALAVRGPDAAGVAGRARAADAAHHRPAAPTAGCRPTSAPTPTRRSWARSARAPSRPAATPTRSRPRCSPT